MKRDFKKGEILLINKPFRWTSFDVVKKIRNITGAEKVGHSGTLDPLATGLLVLCTGTFTKMIDKIQAGEKEYTGTMVMGATTPSYDMETEPDASFSTTHLTENEIIRVTQKFTGNLTQTAPAHSARRVNGKRAYELARKGEEVALKPHEVTISAFEITGIELPHISFRVVCSKGTYIRSLVHEFGKALGSGAYLSSLCRTRIGDFRLENAMTIEDMAAEMNAKP